MHWIPLHETCFKQSHYLLTIVLCAGTLTIIVMHSKLNHKQVSVHELTSNIQWCLSALSVTWQCHQVVWVMQTHHVPISRFRCDCFHPGSLHPYENHAFFVDSAVIVSGVVSYLERCEGDFCLMCMSQSTIVQSVTVVMLCQYYRLYIPAVR
jgi:hypothetical protein